MCKLRRIISFDARWPSRKQIPAGCTVKQTLVTLYILQNTSDESPLRDNESGAARAVNLLPRTREWESHREEGVWNISCFLLHLKSMAWLTFTSTSAMLLSVDKTSALNWELLLNSISEYELRKETRYNIVIWIWMLRGRFKM